MRVLIAEKFEKVGVDGLKELGCDVIHNPDAPAEDLPALMRDIEPDVLIVRGKKVSGEAIKAGTRLSLVIRAGAGVDSIDVKAASNLGVFVANCPGKNSIAVAELVIGLICACDRRIPDQTADLRAGRWNKKEYSKARGLYGRTLGIVGMGQIGNEVRRRAQAFGMRVVAWSRNLTTEDAERMGVEYCATPLDVARHSDVLTINVAGNVETEKFINAEFLDAMKPGAYLINTSRGNVIDEAALLAAIEKKGLRCGLDVYRGEPGSPVGEFRSELAQHRGVYGTHHVGASTDQAQIAIAHEVIRIMSGYVSTHEVLNCVNLHEASPATHVLSVRHRNRPGVLSHVFRAIADESINVEEVENINYHGGEATCARVHLVGCPKESTLERIRTGNENIISVSLRPIRQA